MISLGKQIKAARIKAGLTQAYLSKALGYTSPQFISNIERDVAPVPVQIIPSLAKLIKISEMVLLEGLVSMYRDRCLKILKRKRRNR